MAECDDPVVLIAESSSWYTPKKVPTSTLPSKMTAGDRSLSYKKGSPGVLSIALNRPEEKKEQRRAELASIFYNFSEIPNTWCDDMTYVSITDTSGEWVSYIQHTYIKSRGYGIVDRRKGEWDYGKIVTLNSMTPYYGEDGSGDVNAYYSQLIRMSKGVDLVCCDSSLASPFVALYVAVSSLKHGGSFVCKLETIDESLIYLAMKSFEWITLFRPLMSHVYLVCFGSSPNVSVTNLLEGVIESGTTIVPGDEVMTEWIDYTARKLVSLDATREFDWMTVRRILDV